MFLTIAQVPIPTTLSDKSLTVLWEWALVSSMSRTCKYDKHEVRKRGELTLTPLKILGCDKKGRKRVIGGRGEARYKLYLGVQKAAQS